MFEKHLMGYTMRTDRYRLVVWRDHREPDAEPIYIELYDHDNDPTETVNVAGKDPKVVAGLLDQFDAGWKGGVPEASEDAELN
jgi:iduronate 2-sulfatase